MPIRPSGYFTQAGESSDETDVDRKTKAEGEEKDKGPGKTEGMVDSERVRREHQTEETKGRKLKR
jgi:hypothetical protein